MLWHGVVAKMGLACTCLSLVAYLHWPSGIVGLPSYFYNACIIVCVPPGDSRAVLCRTNTVVDLSSDHKPDRPDEVERIKAAGGCVLYNGGPRVMGVLGMSRAIGDAWLHRYGIIPDPEVTVRQRTGEDELLIIASDGLWGAVSSETAAAIARRCMDRATSQGVSRAAGSRIAAKVLSRTAARLGSRDNITVLVVDLSPLSGMTRQVSPVGRGWLGSSNSSDDSSSGDDGMSLPLMQRAKSPAAPGGFMASASTLPKSVPPENSFPSTPAHGTCTRTGVASDNEYLQSGPENMPVAQASSAAQIVGLLQQHQQMCAVAAQRGDGAVHLCVPECNSGRMGRLQLLSRSAEQMMVEVPLSRESSDT